MNDVLVKLEANFYWNGRQKPVLPMPKWFILQEMAEVQESLKTIALAPGKALVAMEKRLEEVSSTSHKREVLEPVLPKPIFSNN